MTRFGVVDLTQESKSTSPTVKGYTIGFLLFMLSVWAIIGTAWACTKIF